MIKKITLKALQPLHLWVWNFWVVAETGIFVMPWQIVSWLGNQQNSFIDIDKNFDEILEKLSVFIPKNLENSLNNKEIERFKIENIWTYVSTAVDAINHGAIDNSLHEIEYIKPWLEFVWYVEVDENKKLKINDKEFEVGQWLEFTIWWEAKYWFGRIKIKNIENANNFDLQLKKIDDNLKTIFPVFLRVYDEKKWFGKKWVYKGFYWF